MDTYQIEIIEPKAKKLLEDLANLNLITVRPLDPKKMFKRLLDKMRSAGGDATTPEEIMKEVESTRAERYARKSKDPSDIGHQSLD
jgi:hypothetical protein